VMKVFHDVTPLVEPLSLDEAFLDVTGARRLHGDAHQIARRIRTTIWDNEHLTCSVGIAPTKFLAKLSSEQAKPKASPTGPVFGRGVFEVEAGRELDFLHPLPVRALWGVGKATATRLAALGVETVADLAHTPLETLEQSLGTASGRHLHALANGVDDREVEVERETKSISHEETFAHDLTEAATLDIELVRQCDAVAQRLRDSGLTARTAQIKVRFGDFNTITRRLTAPQPFTSGMDLLAMARELFATVDPTQGIRLLGVGVANLSSGGGEQLALNLDEDVERTTTDDLLDDVRTRFGVGSIGPASAAVRGELRVKRRGQQQWGPNQSES